MGTFEATVPRSSITNHRPNTLLSSVSSNNNNNNLEQSYINWTPSFTPMLHITVPSSRYSWLIGSYVSQKEAGFVSTSMSLFRFCCWSGTALLGSLKHKDVLQWHIQTHITGIRISATLTIIIISNTENSNLYIYNHHIKCSFNQFTLLELFAFCYQLTASFSNTFRTLQVISPFLNLLQYFAGSFWLCPFLLSVFLRP
jgi:hypothetical protein